MQKVEANDIELIDDKPQVVNADLRKFNRTAQIVAEAVTALSAITVIENQQQLDHAMQVLKEAKTVEKKIEEKRKELVTPFNNAVKKINDHAKAIVVTLPVAIDNCKKVVLAFQEAEKKRVEKERFDARSQQLLAMGLIPDTTFFHFQNALTIYNYQLEQCDEAQWSNVINHAVAEINTVKQREFQQQKESAEDDAMFGTDDVVSPTIEAWAPVEAPVSTTPVVEMAKVKGVTKRWVFEVTNIKQLPIEYLQVNDVAVRQAIAKGERLIPGVRIYQEESLTIR